jgi:Cu-Zn family superoxide dismutase
MNKELIIKVIVVILLIVTIIYFAFNGDLISQLYSSMVDGAVAVFKQDDVYGEVLINNYRDGVKVKAKFTKLPDGKHGFHIHKAGDLRGEGCHGLCEHYDVGKNTHGGDPEHDGIRHTGDLGNIELKNGKFEKDYYIKGISVKDLWGRSIIVHADEDDLGNGSFEDSKVTGHSGARIACAIFGRAAGVACKPKYDKTRKQQKK